MTDLPVDYERPEGDESSAGPPPPWIEEDGAVDMEMLSALNDQAEGQVDL